MSCCVYVITAQCGRLYVGVTKNLLVRVRQHLRADTRVGRAMRKRGWRPRVVFRGTREECLLEEVRLIQDLGTLHPRGLNMTSGGDGVVGEADEVRAARSLGMKRAMADPERLERARRDAEAIWENNREGVMDGLDAARATMSEKAVQSWTDAEVRARRTAAISAGMKRSWTPERRAAASRMMKEQRERGQFHAE